MRPYWIEIRPVPSPTPLNRGAGITARSEADARELFDLAFGQEHQILNVSQIADMSSIEQGHVAPNMGNALIRGVWFPLGYDDIAVSKA